MLPADPQETEAMLGQGMLGSRASTEWALLRSLLQRHGALRTADGLLVHGGCLHVAVADAIFKVDRRLGLPVWLLQMFTVSHRLCFVTAALSVTVSVWEGVRSK